MYIYENHMGGFYTDDDYLDYDDLYCETCGDSDSCLGWFDTPQEFLKDMADEISVKIWQGGHNINYILEFLGCFDEKITKEEAIKIISENRSEEMKKN